MYAMRTFIQSAEATIPVPMSFQKRPIEVIFLVKDPDVMAENTQANQFAKRPIGLAKDEFVLSEAFFEPLPDDFLAYF